LEAIQVIRDLYVDHITHITRGNRRVLFPEFYPVCAVFTVNGDVFNRSLHLKLGRKVQVIVSDLTDPFVRHLGHIAVNVVFYLLSASFISCRIVSIIINVRQPVALVLRCINILQVINLGRDGTAVLRYRSPVKIYKSQAFNLSTSKMLVLACVLAYGFYCPPVHFRNIPFILWQYILPRKKCRIGKQHLVFVDVRHPAPDVILIINH